MKNKGITLIALVITIIVLLILAGISISLLTGDNGILSKAKAAKEETNTSGIEEANRLSNYNEFLDNYTTRGTTTSNLSSDNLVAKTITNFSYTTSDTVVYQENVTKDAIAIISYSASLSTTATTWMEAKFKINDVDSAVDKMGMCSYPRASCTATALVKSGDTIKFYVAAGDIGTSSANKVIISILYFYL